MHKGCLETHLLALQVKNVDFISLDNIMSAMSSRAMQLSFLFFNCLKDGKVSSVVFYRKIPVECLFYIFKKHVKYIFYNFLFLKPPSSQKSLTILINHFVSKMFQYLSTGLPPLPTKTCKILQYKHFYDWRHIYISLNLHIDNACTYILFTPC